MLPTLRLYYRDTYLAAFDAEIIESAAAPHRVYLDRTAFYPTSGGQPHDRGSLNSVPVLDVIDEGDRIAHVLAAPLPPGPVSAHIDWNRRYDHMQQHTAQHLLSAVFVDLLDMATLSFHLGPAISTIELATPRLLDAQIDSVEARANQIVREGRAVAISFESAEEIGRASCRERV